MLCAVAGLSGVCTAVLTGFDGVWVPELGQLCSDHWRGVNSGVVPVEVEGVGSATSLFFALVSSSTMLDSHGLTSVETPIIVLTKASGCVADSMRCPICGAPGMPGYADLTTVGVRHFAGEAMVAYHCIGGGGRGADEPQLEAHDA